MARAIEKFDAITSAATENPCILVVEDNFGCLTVITAYLDLCGCVYDIARNGEEAVHKAKTGEYALILMDVKMRCMDGFEATRRIREFERAHGKKTVPIMGVTAYALLGDRERCTAAGMDDYISKPVDYLCLTDKLETLLPFPLINKSGL